MKDKKAQIERIARYDHFIQARAGRAVRPYRMDGYVNFLNKYGTSRDSSETYQFVGEPEIPDSFLTEYYESNGLFAKIIDAPAEEAVKNGFELLDITDDKIINFYKEGLDELDWEEVFSQGMKWQRLFGGAIAVMLINDGHGIDEPLDWRHIKSIDDIVLFDRSVVEPDYASLYHYDPRDPFSTRGSRLGSPEYYRVNSLYGNFIVHESRVLEFKNGVLPENTMHTNYRTWGLPEYLRINRAIRDAEVSHGTASKLLDRSIQAVYKMKNLSEMLSTQDGEDMVLRRMQVIDMARGLLSSMVIDAEGEDYGFQTFTFTGVADVIDTTCNFVSALTNIPQTILFGKAPQGFSTNDESGLETWYSYVRRLQKRSMRSNLRYLLSVLFQAGLRTGEIEEIPEIKIEFNPLKVVSETEQLDIDQKRAQVQLTKAQTAQAYIDMQVMDSTEVRNNLAKSEEFDIECVLDDYDEEELFENDPSQQEPEGGMPGMEGAPGMEGMPPMEQGQVQPQAAEGSAAPNAPAATKLPQDMTEEDLEQAEEKNLDDESTDARLSGVGVLVVRDGKILCGTRNHDTGYGLICGPGGHIEDGETSEEAAIREAQEEFSITPKAVISLGNGPIEPETNTYPEIFLCTEWEGEPKCESDEMTLPRFLALDEIYALGDRLFQPFADGVELLVAALVNDEFHEDSAEKNIDFRSVCDNVSLRDFILQFGNELREDADIPDDKVEFATAENGKVFAFDPETGEKSGLGPEIDNETEKDEPESEPTEKPDSDNNEETKEKEPPAEDVGANAKTTEEDERIGFRDKVKSGEINLDKIKSDFNKHFKDSPAYKEGKSYFTVSKEKAIEIAKGLFGKGIPRFNRHGEWMNQENVHCGEVIGNNLYQDQYNEPTEYADIHYSKDGWHMVPSWNRSDKK